MKRDLWGELDPLLKRKILRLHQLSVCLRWFSVLLCWSVLAPIAFWSLREEISIVAEYFTWAALRYTFIYNPLETLFLGICIGMTTGVLVWQSGNILWGMSPQYKKNLRRQVQKIEACGKVHPFWYWLDR